MRRVGFILILLMLGIDISFAETDYIADFQKNHPYLFVTTLVLLPVGWLFLCGLTGLDSQIGFDK